MKEVEKFLKKLSGKDRSALLVFLEALEDPAQHTLLKVKKLRGSDFYRVRKRRFRIIFHFEGREVVVDAIRLRREATYKDF